MHAVVLNFKLEGSEIFILHKQTKYILYTPIEEEGKNPWYLLMGLINHGNKRLEEYSTSALC